MQKLQKLLDLAGNWGKYLSCLLTFIRSIYIILVNALAVDGPACDAVKKIAACCTNYLVCFNQADLDESLTTAQLTMERLEEYRARVKLNNDVECMMTALSLQNSLVRANLRGM